MILNCLICLSFDWPYKILQINELPSPANAIKFRFKNLPNTVSFPGFLSIRFGLRSSDLVFRKSYKPARFITSIAAQARRTIVLVRFKLVADWILSISRSLYLLQYYKSVGLVNLLQERPVGKLFRNPSIKVEFGNVPRRTISPR